MAFASPVEEKGGEMEIPRNIIQLGENRLRITLVPERDTLLMSAVEQGTHDEFRASITPSSIGMNVPDVNHLSEFIKTAMFTTAPDMKVVYGFSKGASSAFGEETPEGKVDPSQLSQSYTAGDSFVIMIEVLSRWHKIPPNVIALDWVEQDDLDKLKQIVKHQQEQIASLKATLASVLERVEMYLPKPLLSDENYTRFLTQSVLENVPGTNVEFQVLFTSLRDGDLSAVFHAKCDNKGATLTIARDKSGNMFGGYNPNSWQSTGSYRNVPGAFLFILEMDGKDTPLKLNIKHGKESTIYDHGSYGPTFGDGHDLCIANKCTQKASSNHRFGYTYGGVDPGNSTRFHVDVYEVFRVVVT